MITAKTWSIKSGWFFDSIIFTCGGCQHPHSLWVSDLTFFSDTYKAFYRCDSCNIQNVFKQPNANRYLVLSKS